MAKFLWQLISPYKKIVVWSLVFQIAQTMLSLMLPRINASIIDTGVANGDLGYISTQGIVMVVLSLLQFVFAIGASVMGARAALKVGMDLREKIYDTILSYSSKELSVFGAATLITRATNDAENVVYFLTIILTIIISSPILFIGGMILALFQNLQLSTVILITIPVMLGISAAYILRIIPFYRTRQELTDRINGVLRDQITGVRVVKAFMKEKKETEKLNKVNTDLFKLNVSVTRTSSFMSPLFTLIINAATVLLLWHGGVLAEHGMAGVGQIISFITYLSLILTAVLSATMVFILWPQSEISAGRIQEILNTSPSIQAPQQMSEAPAKKGEVTFDHVSSSFSPENPEVEPVLKDLSFVAEPGKMTAIIGSTGSGKSTLLNLIPRLLDTTSGTVFIDGKDIREYPAEELNEMIALVPQKAFLFKGTLAENLRHGNPDASDEELWQALKIAQADEFIRNKEGGLYTEVSEGGSNFSGGQRQRLAIARAVVRNPKIILFDDSFSALDYTTDRNLRKALEEITSESTVIVVAQRISSIRNADQIIVLNNGEIEAIGTHDELMKNSNTYQEIAASQPSEESHE